MADDKDLTMQESRREFRDPVTNDKYYIAAPTADDARKADWQYSKVYTKSLMEDITTAAEMMDILMRRGVIGPEFELRQKELTDELAKHVETLTLASDSDAKQEAAVKVSQARAELFNWNQRLNGPMANTCEQIADDARLEYLTSCMVQDKNGNKVWEDYSDFLTEKNQSLAMRARFEVMLYLQGLDSDFLEKTPEALAIKEIEEEAQAKAAEALAELEKVKEEAEESEEIEEKKVKKTTKARKPRKKTTRKKTKKKSTEKKEESKE